MKRIMVLQVVLVISLLFYNLALAKPSDVPNYRAIPLKGLDTCIDACGEPPDAEDLVASESYQLCVADCHPKIDLLNQSVIEVQDQAYDLQDQIDNIGDNVEWSGQLTIAVRDPSYCNGNNTGTIWFDPSVNDGGMRICLGSNHIGKFSGAGGTKLIDGHLVFVTSQKYPGYFKQTDDEDTICQGLANSGSMTSGLGLTWHAIISTQADSARSRLESFILEEDAIFSVGNPYTLVSSTGSGLWDGGIEGPISIDENGQPTGFPPFVWTGTNNNGNTSLYNCQDWSNTGYGVYGYVGSTNNAWVNYYYNASCNNYYRLYCISEQTVQVEVNY